MKKAVTTLLISISLSICLSANSLSATSLWGAGNEKNYSVVSPNPARTSTTIKFYNPDEIPHRIEIYDVIGNKVATYDYIEKSNFPLDVSDFDAGVYFYFILNGNERISTGRLIVQH